MSNKRWGVLIVVISAALAGSLFFFAGERSDRGPSPAKELASQSQIDEESRPFADLRDSPEREIEKRALSEAGVVNFDDGEILIPNWRRPDDLPTLVAPFSDDVPQLVALAKEGDALSSYSLHLVLEGCRSAPSSAQERDEIIIRMQQTHEIVIPGETQLARITDPEQLPLFVQSIESSYENCKGIDTQYLVDSNEWLEIAATDSGPPSAKLEYAATLSDPLTRQELYRKAWEQGDIESLFYLSHELQLSYNSGEEPTNNVNAAAMLLAYSKLLEAAMSTHGEIANRRINRVNEIYAEASLLLASHELTRAEELAKEIIRSNPKCCLSL